MAKDVENFQTRLLCSKLNIPNPWQPLSEKVSNADKISIDSDSDSSNTPNKDSSK